MARDDAALTPAKGTLAVLVFPASSSHVVFQKPEEESNAE